MKIKVKGQYSHLTATEIKAIKAILAAGLKEGRVGRKSYRITEDGSDFKVLIFENASNDYGKMFLRSNLHFFSVTK